MVSMASTITLAENKHLLGTTRGVKRRIVAGLFRGLTGHDMRLGKKKKNLINYLLTYCGHFYIFQSLALVGS